MGTVGTVGAPERKSLEVAEIKQKGLRLKAEKAFAQLDLAKGYEDEAAEIKEGAKVVVADVCEELDVDRLTIEGMGRVDLIYPKPAPVSKGAVSEYLMKRHKFTVSDVEKLWSAVTTYTKPTWGYYRERKGKES